MKALLSPSDVLLACQQLEALQLPVRLRSFRSGVLVVQSAQFQEDSVLLRLTQFLQATVTDQIYPRLTAAEWAEKESISLTLAQEYLDVRSILLLKALTY